MLALMSALMPKAWADDPPPPPPPEPSAASIVGQTVTNPLTATPTKVKLLIYDPAGTPTVGDTAFVVTEDGYAFLVKDAGELIYNQSINDEGVQETIGFLIVSKDPGTKTAVLRLASAPPDTPDTQELVYQLKYSELQDTLFSEGSDGTDTPPAIEEGAAGVRAVYTGRSGRNGRTGALFVPPSSGGRGADGPTVIYPNNATISAHGTIGIEAGSIGGAGGKGGDSWLSFWSARNGGDGGAGGAVVVTNSAGRQVAASGTDMHGIFAYSRSGAAGNGGYGHGAPGGGVGGHASNGGPVAVANAGTVITTGDGGFGIYGLSVSNNGGAGGGQWGIVGRAGYGGGAGNGGAVTITNQAGGSIYTSGDYAHGILAQSIGGTGGASGKSGNLIVSLRNDAGGGGTGGAVTVTNAGLIQTGTDAQPTSDSRGIFAQSIGGGGGSGGGSWGLVALGGSGQDGGSGGTVTVTNESTGRIITTGARSDGIFAQSVGGSGGRGAGAGGLVAIGGDGDNAGNGGEITVANFGSVRTAGDYARGIVAQSIGGGGGDGGSSGGFVSVGGGGKGGGIGALVKVTNGGSIITEGADAKGIVAQSIGGGGGNGGSAGAVGLFGGVAIGGKGGKGGEGGVVTATLQGRDDGTASLIQTSGERASGLFAQSVGGGGGTGGGAVAISEGFGAAASVALGGKGGVAGNGGAVTLLAGPGASDVQTGGPDAAGIVLQSVGGGGGTGGYALSIADSAGPVSGSLAVSIGGAGEAGGNGGEVTVGTFDARTGAMIATGFNGSVLTTGERSTGLLAQSIGGGGGSGGLAVSGAGAASPLVSGSISIAFGGDGGKGGIGKAVHVGAAGDITTKGMNSTGLLAQSIGGGGGNGGGSISASLAASGLAAGSVSVGIGGKAGNGSTGGEVIVVTRAGTISTSGANSTGILAESVGGTGGNGGYAIAAGGAGAGIAAGAVNVGLGGKGGKGGDGGKVTANLESDVHTQGENSTAIIVQSVGGGGGNGGFAITAGAAGAGIGSGAVSVGLGGTGGAGGIGGTVSAHSKGMILTEQARSAGFVAQSVGGGGGNGGYSVAVAGSAAGVGSGAVTVGLGGDGGKGNNGGAVTAGTSVGSITTTKDDSIGVLAQSVGGGGGNGGFSVSGAGSGAGVGSGAIAVGLGGKGGAGGQGGAVTLTVENDVGTSGADSTAVVAQSIGGGGGNGGFNLSGALSGAGIGSGSIGVGLGGNGEAGGDAGLVTASVKGTIETAGGDSTGILAQAVGGGGGNGGFNISGTVSGAGVGAGAVSVGLGGKGAVAGNGGLAGPDPTVVLHAEGSVTTHGDHAAGIIAQSIGGGGGNGGFNVAAELSGAGEGAGAVSVGLGGGGGAGGAGRNVLADPAANVWTYGDNATGILVQSVGGGGGDGGFNVSGSLSGAGLGSGGIAVGLGGSGGNGSVGGDVVATAGGTIETHGAKSSGFIAQSLGGGGGNGGFNISGSLSGAGSGSGAISVGLGGAGGTGNDAGAVTATAKAGIWTFGAQSTGVLAQSVGGGGGNGGFDITAGASGAGTGSGSVTVGLAGGGGGGGKGGRITLRVEDTVYTKGDDSAAIVGQSIGGGGGNGGFSVSASASGAGTGSGTVGVGLGGSGAKGADAGAVDVRTFGDVETHGARSLGVLAQSVGGGGGNGGFAVAVAGSGAGTGSGAVSVGLGGSGEGGGSGSTVGLTVANNVATWGDNATGVVAQSVGGGGGSGGFSVTVAGSAAGTGSGAVGVGLGGSAGSGGAGGAVTSTVTGAIGTHGDNAAGLLVQSVGGGGGNGGFSVSATIVGAGTGSGDAAVGIGGSGGDGGDSAKVISTLTGDVTTAGANAIGVIAQSLGGGGGNGGMSVAGTIAAAKSGAGAASVSVGGSGGGGGNGAAVENTVTGDVVTAQSGSGGVIAQSVGGGGGNGGISISGSVALGGSGSGAVSVGVGGSGGNGGYAGGVKNTVTGSVATSGDYGFGVVAQSLGGGGGNGGLNVTGAISASKENAGALGVGVGGSGGDGGQAADVTNTVTGFVQTLGHDAIGVLAQSVGGGGGNGGLNVTGVITAGKSGAGSLAVGVGGFGGGGKWGAAVTNTVTGGVVTTGANSSAIVAQSLGGGGGNGGLNVTGSLNATKESGGTLGVGVGGFGGDGGDAGTVISTVATTAAHPWIATTGASAPAVVAQSVAGSGGTGGTNVTAAVNIAGKNGAAIGIGVGGFGGGGGQAGGVTLDVTGDIITLGRDSTGLVAQSVGGGGGSGGTDVAGTLSIVRTGTGGAASIGVGGFGGKGGNAGDVSAVFGGSITAASQSTALFAQSVGGGGGRGGVNVSGGFSYASGKEGDGHALAIGVGGFGGGGGSGGRVDVTVRAGSTLSSAGDDRSTVVAQSIGGGGGMGAVNVSGGLTTDAPIVIGVGGFGGKGGTAGAVDVNVEADVAASGQRSAGIFAQSVGGGGGNGGLNVSGSLSTNNDTKVPAFTFGIGGFGGSGAISGAVDVDQAGTVTTDGAWSHGIAAQSLAGGGGNGALNVAGNVDAEAAKGDNNKSEFAVMIGLGGHGGAGADAGGARVASVGAIATAGDYARGIFVQSVGGGGGTGGLNIAGVAGKDESPVVIGVGGFGGGGGNAGTAAVTRGAAGAAAGLILTGGTGAYGIEASSIGGGGGDAGGNILLSSTGTSGSSDAEKPKTRPHPQLDGVDPEVFTNYDKVLDELEGRQKTGAKPAKKSEQTTYAFQVGIGGSGGDGGDGGAADVANIGDILTRGNASHGILAQSIAGGGGNASLNLALMRTGKSEKADGFNFMLGGATGDGGSAGAVDVVHDGRIDTYGNHALGIIAQSIGGGGGNAGLDYTNTSSEGSTLDIKIGRQGGTGGAGGAVRVDAGGVVWTRGDDAAAILAQSIGNGGGSSSSTAISGSYKRDLKGQAAKDSEKEIEFDVEVGIEGGVGGAAGTVDVGAGGRIVTEGDGSHGILAQSIGGGGGKAGDVGGFEMVTSSYSLMVGGSGGQGGTGGAVTVASDATIDTLGDTSVGLLAQSIGGGGGEGGGLLAIGKRKEKGGFLLGVGGMGGDGSTGGAVTVANGGTITTGGREAHGLLAQSIGGGGGKAGTIVRDLFNQDAAGDIDIEFLLGGSGGTGAASGAVSATNRGRIETFGEDAIAVVAQSVGGGGGAGSYVISNSISTKGGGTKLNMAIGGEGGTGGSAGAVTVANRAGGPGPDAGTIETWGDRAYGIFAMSLGGGGGNGGVSITSNDAIRAGDKPASNAFGLSIGGVGGHGGTGAAVTVTNSGAIATHGDAAHAILAQSVGGGGGNGGLTLAGNLVLGSKNDSNQNLTGALAIGGSGGDGNAAGDVTVNNSGAITAEGTGAYGIFAQSVGGGGGNGGFTAGLSSSLKTNPAADPAPYFTSIGIGGRGGAGGDSGNVVVNHSGSIVVSGNNAYGIYAQSVSGGGGTAGFSLSSPVWMATDLVMDLALGFSGGSGVAGTARVNTMGTIVTTGANSRGIFVQEVAGGGGDLNVFMDVSTTASEYASGDNASATNAIALGARAKVKSTLSLGVAGAMDAVSGAIVAVHTGDLASLGDISVPSLLQAVGGGGGNGKLQFVVDGNATVDLSAGLGGSASQNADGAVINARRDGQVYTAGARSAGSSVQSIGGGGGSVDLAVRTAAASALPCASAPGMLKAAAAPAAPGERVTALSLGASGGANNDGGGIDLQFTGPQLSAGERSPAVVVQSVGAGGGSALVTGMDRLSVALGGTAGAQGDGGSISLVNAGVVQTTGTLSHGILLQSIGGGGGAVLTDAPAGRIELALRADNAGNGGDIRLRQAGDVFVGGDRSIAVAVQSLGGGGGMVDRLFADTAGGAGRSGAVTLDIDGNVAATGAGGIGIFAQSAARDGSGPIAVTLGDGDAVIGGAGGAAIWLSGGSDNHVTSRGLIETLDGIAGTAVRGTSGNDVIDNYGTFVGQFALGGGADRFVNHAGARFTPGAALELGAEGNLLVNEGLLLPGGTERAQRIDLVGSFRQTASGTTQAEFDCATGEGDAIVATGTVDVAGRIEVSLINPQLIKAGRYAEPLFSGAQGATISGATLIMPQTVVISCDLGNATGKAVALDFAVDFRPAGAGLNLAAVGDYFNRVQAAGSSPALADTVLRLINYTDDAAYAGALAQLSPEFYAQNQALLVRSARQIAESFLDARPEDGRVAGAKGRSVWFQEDVESGSHNAGSGYQLMDYSSTRSLLGLQQTTGPWTAGIGISVDHSSSRGDAGNWRATGETKGVGIALRREAGGTTLAASLGYGWNVEETRRAVTVTSPVLAQADRYHETAIGVLRLSHDFSRPTRGLGRLHVRPSVDVGFLRLTAREGHETGAGAQGLVLPAFDETHAWTTPRLTLASDHATASGVGLRPFVSLGLHYLLNNPRTEIRAGLMGAPAGVDPMVIPVDLDNGSLQVDAGLEIASKAGISVRLAYRNISARGVRVDSGNIKADIPF